MRTGYTRAETCKLHARRLTHPINRSLLTLLLYCAGSATLAAEPLPVIDMHLHALPADGQGPPPLAMCTPMNMPTWDPAQPYAQTFMSLMKNPACSDPVWSPETDEEVRTRTLASMQRRNVYGVLSGTPERVKLWMDKAPGRFYAGLGFRLGPDAPSPEALASLHASGQLEVFAEVTNQYAGIEPNDPRMAPYWELAEELDLPVGIHIGTGPPGVLYLGAAGYRARMHSALTLEEVLVRHPRLRVYVAHAGYPLLDDMLALMYAHPQVHVDTGVIVFTQPRAAFYRYLRGMVEAGFGKRVMFGSDQMVWPETIERSIQVIEEAPFLSEAEKRDILYNNAARFLRLDEEEIARHHGRRPRK